jgi:chromosome segregation ATPase
VPLNLNDWFVSHRLTEQIARAESAERALLATVESEQAARSEIAQLIMRLERALAENADTERQMAEGERRIAEAERRVADALAEKADAERRVAEGERRIRDAQEAHRLLLAHARALDRMNRELSKASARLRADVAGREASLNVARDEARRAETELSALRTRLSDLVGSSSWRITAPVRALSRLVRG